ncbi:MAG: FAD-dependent oxidoreductase, partial [Burkholderiales bacterium]|nr:FAD-dependent oxidoreductase [Burkholderiales bacterium]
MKRVAVVGSGIAGLAAARTLERAEGLRVTLFESAERVGGHANTLDVTLPDRAGRPVTHGVDTGFLVYNERTYPQLTDLF